MIVVMDVDKAMGGGGSEGDGAGRLEVFEVLCDVDEAGRGVLLGEGDVDEAVEEGIGLEGLRREVISE